MTVPKSLLPYFFLGLINLAGCLADIELMRSISKPLQMPALAFFFIKEAPKTPLNRYVLMALFLSWLGDTLLMFASSAPQFFMLGLASFLLAHLVYTVINISAVNVSGGLKPQWQDIPFLLYGFLVFGLLKDNLGDMYFPAMAYAVVICIMALSARKRWKRTDNQSFWLVMVGALIFMLSDTLLAFNRFHEPLPQSDLLIMSTYIVAQALIVMGLVVFLKKIPQEAGS